MFFYIYNGVKCEVSRQLLKLIWIFTLFKLSYLENTVNTFLFIYISKKNLTTFCSSFKSLVPRRSYYQTSYWGKVCFFTLLNTLYVSAAFKFFEILKMYCTVCVHTAKELIYFFKVISVTCLSQKLDFTLNTNLEYYI